ncbi:glycosyltransferase [Candidatus Giovannonibacteria bacterium]|nr:glycosyltransferase [Candidatus Giovannonibacteria bacterium]
MKKRIEQYNNPDTLLVISPYPKKGEIYSTGASGIASYTKNVISHIARNVVVLADYEDMPETYEENNSLVLRCFKKNTLTMWLSLFKTILMFTKTKQVLIQFDFALYGSFLTSALIMPLVLLLKLFGYNTSVVLHTVVLDIFKLKGHVGLPDGLKGNIIGTVYNTIFHTFYTMLGFFADRIVVLEEPLKQKLAAKIPEKKIIVIPHGVDTEIVTVDKAKARRVLGMHQDEYVVLFFGFVNWFKGADFFAQTFAKQNKLLGKNVRAVIAGGASATLQSKAYYKKYFTKVEKTVNESKNTIMTGYVPQENMSLYFSAADIVVFPYRHFMNASGVMSLAFSHNKPFIISSELEEMFKAPEFTTALQQTSLQKNDFVFDLTKESCLQLTQKVLKNGIRAKMAEFTGIMREQRSYKNTAFLYDRALFPSTISVSQPALTLTYNK